MRLPSSGPRPVPGNRAGAGAVAGSPREHFTGTRRRPGSAMTRAPRQGAAWRRRLAADAVGTAEATDARQARAVRRGADLATQLPHRATLPGGAAEGPDAGEGQDASPRWPAWSGIGGHGGVLRAGAQTITRRLPAGRRADRHRLTGLHVARYVSFAPRATLPHQETHLKFRYGLSPASPGRWRPRAAQVARMVTRIEYPNAGASPGRIAGICRHPCARDRGARQRRRRARVHHCSSTVASTPVSSWSSRPPQLFRHAAHVSCTLVDGYQTRKSSPSTCEVGRLAAGEVISRFPPDDIEASDVIRTPT